MKGTKCLKTNSLLPKSRVWKNGERGTESFYSGET